MTKTDIAKELLAAAGYTAGIAYLLANWSALPDAIPIHFGLLGHPDGWAPRFMALFLPAIATFLYITLTIGQYFGKPNVPWQITDENRGRIYSITRNLLWWMKTQITWLIAYIEYKQVEVALHRAEGLGVWFAPTFLGMIFLSLAVYFYIGRRAAQAQ